MDQQKLDRAIGRRLKTLRTQAGMTLNELAARSGVSRAMIGRVERAQSSATAALLGKLCAALDVSLSDVVALAEKPPERLVRLADRHTIIERGRTVWSGTSAELMAEPDLQHRYLGI